MSFQNASDLIANGLRQKSGIKPAASPANDPAPDSEPEPGQPSLETIRALNTATPILDSKELDTLSADAVLKSSALTGEISAKVKAAQAQRAKTIEEKEQELRNLPPDIRYREARRQADQEYQAAMNGDSDAKSRYVKGIHELDAQSQRAKATLPLYDSEAAFVNGETFGSEARARYAASLANQGAVALDAIAVRISNMPLQTPQQKAEARAAAAAWCDRWNALPKESRPRTSKGAVAKAVAGADFTAAKGKLLDIISAADNARTHYVSSGRPSALTQISKGLAARRRG